ncbi:XdhC family aldehyde oxidoreductase maturation factor [Thermodesulfobacteriota bacterium]
MKNIYSRILEIIEDGQVSVLATIIRHSGSTPRETGTNFLILENGSSIGTIGGGLLEAEVLEAAKDVFDSLRPKLVKYVLKGEDVSKTDMLCGGEADVFLEPISPQNSDYISVLKKVFEIQNEGGSGILATLIDMGKTDINEKVKIFIDVDGKQTGSLGSHIDVLIRSESQMILQEKQPKLITFKNSGRKKLEIFVEPLTPENILYVFGGGHVSRELVPFAAKVGFKVVVIDDREEFANWGDFPDAFDVNLYPFDNVIDRLPINDSSFIVIVTRGHSHDKTVLSQSLKTEAKYIGMIGSRRKVAIIYEQLIVEGFTKDDLARVYSPIGLDIGGKTPEEIAISIVAELIQVRAGRGKGI